MNEKIEVIIDKYVFENSKGKQLKSKYLFAYISSHKLWWQN